jgi:hypothetical protein
MIDDQDENDRSALHYAARLADPHFYNGMKNTGNIYLPAERSGGETPQEVFLRIHGSEGQ